LIKENPKISIPKIAETIGLSISGVEKNIRNLKQEGVVSRNEGTKSGEWVVKGVWLAILTTMFLILFFWIRSTGFGEGEERELKKRCVMDK
jgi:DNA-binding transcriptional MocR family regulator